MEKFEDMFLAKITNNGISLTGSLQGRLKAISKSNVDKKPSYLSFSMSDSYDPDYLMIGVLL